MIEGVKGVTFPRNFPAFLQEYKPKRRNAAERVKEFQLVLDEAMRKEVNGVRDIRKL